MLPDIYYFNPTCELAIANESPFYTAPAGLRQFESDLGYLPGWLGEEKDLVLVGGVIDPGFRERMRNTGFHLPEFRGLDEALRDTGWLDMPKGRIFPWGWSPAAGRLFKNVLPSCLADFQQSGPVNWHSGHKVLYSRLTAGKMLDRMITEHDLPWLPGKENVPVVCDSHEQIRLELARHRTSVVKTPWSSSGRGLLLFPNVDSQRKNDELLTGMLRQQGFVTVEPWLDKVVDLSFQFNITGGRISYLGRTFFETDRKGRFVRTFLLDQAGLLPVVREFLDDCSGQVAGMLTEALEKSGYPSLHEGWTGVDSMVFRAADGTLKFQPVIEINSRFTMGAIAMKLRQHLAEGSDGYFRVWHSKNGNFQDFCREQERLKPLLMQEGKIECGFMPLTPPLPEHHSGAFLEVERC